MKIIGNVLHATAKNTVVVPTTTKVDVHSRVYNYKGKEIGKVIDVLVLLKNHTC